ncbi:uncharacterized protein LOC111818271 [Octodon degus]|uniref:Uncharacterized protein LOC111818271 n=1 Tax=Octodon degus TaxID=10160 RepID=A0A6P6EZ14_OCTDE|nr:uncharacterized protein LOC111818271 [Octodon degus]
MGSEVARPPTPPASSSQGSPKRGVDPDLRSPGGLAEARARGPGSLDQGPFLAAAAAGGREPGLGRLQVSDSAFLPRTPSDDEEATFGAQDYRGGLSLEERMAPPSRVPCLLLLRGSPPPGTASLSPRGQAGRGAALRVVRTGVPETRLVGVTVCGLARVGVSSLSTSVLSIIVAFRPGRRFQKWSHGASQTIVRAIASQRRTRSLSSPVGSVPVDTRREAQPNSSSHKHLLCKCCHFVMDPLQEQGTAFVMLLLWISDDVAKETSTPLFQTLRSFKDCCLSRRSCREAQAVAVSLNHSSEGPWLLRRVNCRTDSTGP